MSTTFMNEEDTKALCRELYEIAGLSVINATCCPLSFDGVKNWSVTIANTVAVQKCPGKSNNSIYNENENTTRSCLASGIWASKSNYDRCIFNNGFRLPIISLWITGYSISTIALWIALILLRYFRSLRCLRNEIHCNLIISFIVRVIAWFIIVIPQIITRKWPIIIMNITTMIYLFSQVANFFWMFVEGLYLFTIIAWTYGVDRFKIWHYSIIGWGIPFILVSAASISIYSLIGPKGNWFYNSTTKSIKMIAIHIPILISVIVNVLVLFVVIYTLFKKMKQNKVPVPRRNSKLALFSTEYRKAIRAAAVLIPLLGISHCIFIAQAELTQAYQIFNALLTSTQGFFVAVIYCFLNREVKFLIKAKYRSLRGFLPNSSRTRQTLDDSIGPVRRGNSAFKPPTKQDNDNNVFKCRSYRFIKSNNGTQFYP